MQLEQIVWTDRGFDLSDEGQLRAAQWVLVTKATANVLYELDGRPALELYKHYLGTHAASLPSSALLFPLSLHNQTMTITTLSER